MIKGCQKKIIHIKSTNNPYFEEAYFIIKNDSLSETGENDMLKEATRIAEATLSQKKSQDVSSIKKYAYFIFLGASLLSLVFGVFMLFFLILA